MDRHALIALWAVSGMIGVTIAGVVASLTKLLTIGWVAFGAMAAGVGLGYWSDASASRGRIIWAYGLSSGAMITSVSLFLIPSAISHHSAYGGLGIAGGLMGGVALHTVDHDASRGTLGFSPTVWALTVHAVGAGIVIGVVYAAMPSLGAGLGLAIVSHKAPAGYAAAVGGTAVPIALLDLPMGPVTRALVFGLSTGFFFHVAVDFLPYHAVSPQEGAAVHSPIDGLPTSIRSAANRRIAALSPFLGGAVVAFAWGLL